MDYKIKYLKYKNKYLELKKLILKGGNKCNYCGKDNAEFFCPCFTVSYCSEKCKNDDFPSHGESCRKIRKEERIRLLKKLNEGNATAEDKYKLGILYFYRPKDGKKYKENKSRGLAYLISSAEEGYADAQYLLGYIYYDGKEVQKDETQSFIWFKMSADQGNHKAQFHLGNLYFIGHYVNKDVKEAFKWFKLSADQGNAQSQLRLGFIYLHGIGTEKNLLVAFKIFTRFAEQKEDVAQYTLGKIYQNGLVGIVDKNEAEAFKWFKLSADQGNMLAIEQVKAFEAIEAQKKLETGLD
jgi:TPR repeat protein